MNLKRRDENRSKNRRNQTSATLVCKECSKMFTVNIGEICWHYDVGNLIPGFCPDCRNKKKKERQEKRKNRNQEINADVEVIENEEKLVEEI